MFFKVSLYILSGSKFDSSMLLIGKLYFMPLNVENDTVSKSYSTHNLAMNLRLWFSPLIWNAIIRVTREALAKNGMVALLKTNPRL